MSESREHEEVERIKERYRRRLDRVDPQLHHPLNPFKVLERLERERNFAKCLRRSNVKDLGNSSLLEVGCGDGENLIRFLQLGFEPRNMTGIDLLDYQVAVARRKLPSTCTLLIGDVLNEHFGDQLFDVVLQATVFSSILSPAFQERVAEKMWTLTRPGGGIIWHDFVYNNPANPDVKGIPLRRIRELFPQSDITSWRLTLAPPVGRRAAPIGEALYEILDWIPLLRTHRMCWIPKYR